MDKRKNDQLPTDDVRAIPVKSIFILGVPALIVSVVTFFLYNGLNSSAWIIYSIAAISGWLIARVTIVLLVERTKELSTWIAVLTVVVGAFIGMALGQILGFRLIDIPQISAARHEAFDAPLAIYMSMIISPLQSDVLRLYLVFFAVGSFIGIEGLEWLDRLDQGKKKNTL